MEAMTMHEIVLTSHLAMRSDSCVRALLTVGVSIALLLLPPPYVVHAATLTVTNLADENDHSCTDGDCSLRDAIEKAATNDTITFGVTGTITLTLGQLEISKNLTISGPGTATLTVSGNNASRVFHIASGTVTISGVTIAKGYDGGVDGAGISSEGTLSVTDCAFSHNGAENDGGAISSWGPLTVRSCTFTANTAGNDGGGIAVAAWNEPITVTDSTFTGNQAANNGGGIAATMASSVVLDDNTFTGNSAGNDGGAADISVPLTVRGSSFSDNESGNDGGGIRSWDLTAVTSSTFSDNTAGNYGGGLYAGWTTTVTDCTFSNNQAGEGGGIGNADVLVVSNATFSGNHAIEEGGAIGNGYSLVASNCTLSGNSADLGGGGLYSPPIFESTITNTIVANNTGGNCLGTIGNGGHNIDSGISCGWGTANGSKSSTNPLLRALADNGGDTQTMALQSGSPAINQGSNSDCPSTDQRGASRPQGATCDIGAYEYGATPTLIAIAPGSAPIGSPALTLTLTGTNFVSGAVAQWGGPPGTALATTFASATRLQAQVPANRLTTAGSYTITVRDPGPGDGTSAGWTFTVRRQQLYLPVIRR
jgi:CSLREA domain-containing protein